MPEKIQDYVSRGTISVGHAKAIMSLKSEDEQIKMAEDIVKRGYSVRRVEGLTREKNDAYGLTQKMLSNYYNLK